VAAAITQNDIKFMDYLAKHGKDYNTIEEFNLRAALFAKKDAIIAKINANPKHTFRVGHNLFSDWTDAELERINGHVPEADEELPTLNLGSTYAYNYPSSIDWRARGAVTRVKDQGMCGSCWIFSGTAGVEGVYFNKYDRLLEFSEQ